MADGGTYRPPQIVSKIVKRWDESQNHHSRFVRDYERRERSYRGVLRRSSSAAKWRHQYHPPYAFNLLETITANTIEMGLRFDVTPAPKPNLTLQEAMQQLAQVEVVSDLLRSEQRIDQMDFKQRPLFLTAGIGGRGILKTYWDYRTGTAQSQGYKDVPVHDDDGNVLMNVPVITQIKESGILRDHSTTEVVDPRDWTTHESARSLDPCEPGGAQYVFHRCWYSFEQLKDMEKDGFFQNVDRLKDAALDWSSEYADREKNLWEINRTKDLIEVLEYWEYEGGDVRRGYVGNRSVLLRGDVEEDGTPNGKLKDDGTEVSPFWHGRYPFAVCSSMPQPFTTYGSSDIELIEQLQEMLWEMASQRFDNVELINNMVTLVRSDVDDPDAFEYYPGARWPVESPNDVSTLQPPYQLAEVTLRAEALLKGDMQNVTSAAPFASGTETATVDQKTATGASIVMNAAQQRLAVKKFESQKALLDDANMRIKLAQQFVTDRRLVHILGEDGAHTFREIDPIDIQGDFLAELQAMGESGMRQERRAEATQLSQVLMQSAPMAAASGAPLNTREVLTWMLKRWGIDDADRFFSQQPNAMGVAGEGPPGPGGAPPGAEGPPNMGTTSGTAVDASKPSATGGLSMSPAMMLQRALTMSGGAANAPTQ